MARLAIAAAGAAIGYSIGGPTGASIGWSIGSAAGTYLFPTNTEGPRLNDMKIKDGGYGAGIPHAYGTSRVNGNVIWSSDLIEKKTEQGGKGGDTYTVYTYSVNCAVGVCEGPGTCVRRIWANGKVIYDNSQLITSDKKIIPLENITIYLGDEEQMPDPVMEAALGAGNVPAYRGLTYVVFEGLQLASFGNRLPKFDFEIAGSASGTEVKIVHMDPAIYSCTYHFRKVGDQVWSFDDYDPDNYPIAAIEIASLTGDYIETVQIPGLSTFWQFGGYAMLETETDFWLFGPTTTPLVDTACKVSKADPTDQTCYTITASKRAVLSFPTYANDGVWIPYDTYPVVYKKWSISTHSLTGEERYLESDFLLIPPMFGAIETSDGTIYYISKTIYGNYGFSSVNASGTNTSLYTSADPLLSILQIEAGSFYVISTNKLLKISATGSVLQEISIPEITNYGTFDQRPFKLAYDSERHSLIWMNYNADNPNQCQIATFDIDSGVVQVAINFLDSGVLSDFYYEISEIDGAWWMGADIVLSESSRGYGIIRIVASPCSIFSQSLSTVVTHICGQVGFSDLDVADVASINVKGYVRNNQMTARAAIEPLMQAYSVDAIESDGNLKFIRKSNALLGPVITADELGAGSKTSNAVDLVNLTRTQELELPVEVAVKYIDRDLEYDAGQQYARRSSNVLSEGKVSIDVPVVMSATEALQLANTQLYRAWIQRDKVAFSTTQKFGAYEPTDLVYVPFGSGNRLIRLTQKVEDGVQIQWEGVSDDLSIYAQVGSATGGLAGGSQTTATYANILLYVFETPVLRDQDDGLQFTVVVGAANGSTWTGGDLYYAPAGTTAWVRIGTLPAPAVVGSLTSILSSVADPIYGVLDTTNTVTVRLTTGTLSSVTYDELIAGYNTAAIRRSDNSVEVLGFQTATLIAPNTYTLSNLFRRIRENSSYSGAPIGAQFILLNPAQATLVPMQSYSLNQNFDFKAPSVGQSVSDASYTRVTLTGMSKKPLSPVDVTGWRDASDNLTIQWTRRSRIGGSWVTGENGPLGEASEAYQIDILQGTNIKRTLTSNTNSVVYTAADQTTDFGSPQPVKVAVYQMSEMVGRGYPASPAIGLAIASITPSILGPSGLTDQLSPTSGSIDDGYWEINLPWDFNYIGTNYSTICVGTNGYILFGGTSSTYYPNASTPNYPKIFIGAGDLYAKAFYYGEEGTAPNRTFRIRYETTTYALRYGDPKLIWEATFYENDTYRVDVQIETNTLTGGLYGAYDANYLLRSFSNAPNTGVKIFYNLNTLI